MKKKKHFLLSVLSMAILIPSFSQVSAAVDRANIHKDNSAHREKQPVLEGKYLLKNPQELGEGIKLSIGSSLLHLPGDPKNIFYSTADRGPNGQIKAGEEDRRTFPLETYTPTIYKLELSKGEIKVLKAIPLKLAQGKDPITGTSLISGVSNLEGLDEVPYDGKAEKQLPYDTYGLDTEGLAYNPNDGTFWLCDEYRPSLIQVKRDGTILQRLLPAGMASKYADAPNVPVKDILPSVYAKRTQNKGFEGVSITPDGKWMFAIIQAPLANPDKASSKNSRIMRVIKLNLQTLKSEGEYAYLAEDAKGYAGLTQSDLLASDIIAKDKNLLLVDERDNKAGSDARLKRIYQIDLSKATNILGKYDNAQDGSKTVEQMTLDELKQSGIRFPEKKMVLDLLKFGYPYEKAEGITMADKHTIAIANDNDFGIDNTTQTGIPSAIWTFKVSDDKK